MNSQFPELSCTLTFSEWDDERASLDVKPEGHPHPYPVALFSSNPEDVPAVTACAHRLRDCWNACHGLDLPASAPPGILADAVHALKMARVIMRRFKELQDSGDINGKEWAEYGMNCEAIESANQALDKLNPAPVSPPPEKTKVVFRVFRDDEDASNPLAVFPEVPSDVAGNFCESYQPVGQHSACDPCIGSRGDTRAATPEEYAALKRELEGNGYVLDVRQKVTDAMHVARRKAASR